MNYTTKDIEKAKELKSMGYNWIATNKNGRPFAYGRMPYRCADDDNDRNEYNIWDNQPGTPWLMLSKEYFKSITWENEPVYVDEIIAEGEEQVNEDTAIERLTAELDITKAALDNLIFYCTNDKKFMCEAFSEKCPKKSNGTLLCGSDECGKIMLDFYIENARREIGYEITEERE